MRLRLYISYLSDDPIIILKIGAEVNASVPFDFCLQLFFLKIIYLT